MPLCFELSFSTLQFKEGRNTYMHKSSGIFEVKKNLVFRQFLVTD